MHYLENEISWAKVQRIIADQPRYDAEEETKSLTNRTEKKIKTFDDSEMISYLSRFQ